jgi:hypothetical protein
MGCSPEELSLCAVVAAREREAYDVAKKRYFSEKLSNPPPQVLDTVDKPKV